jgi:hypothetical protein
MKTDRVLMMSECLASWYGGVSCVKPPADDARHVPVAAQDDVEIGSQDHVCRCDRWGHPCEGCQRPYQPVSREEQKFFEKKF